MCRVLVAGAFEMHYSPGPLQSRHISEEVLLRQQEGI